MFLQPLMRVQERDQFQRSCSGQAVVLLGMAGMSKLV